MNFKARLKTLEREHRRAELEAMKYRDEQGRSIAEVIREKRRLRMLAEGRRFHEPLAPRGAAWPANDCRDHPRRAVQAAPQRGNLNLA